VPLGMPLVVLRVRRWASLAAGGVRPCCRQSLSSIVVHHCPSSLPFLCFARLSRGRLRCDRLPICPHSRFSLACSLRLFVFCHSLLSEHRHTTLPHTMASTRSSDVPPLQEENAALVHVGAPLAGDADAPPAGAEGADAPPAALLDGTTSALDDVNADDADDVDAPPAGVLVADIPVPLLGDVAPPADVVPPADVAPLAVMPLAGVTLPAALVTQVAGAKVVVVGAAADAVTGACAAAVAGAPAAPGPPHWPPHCLFAEVAWGSGACVWGRVAALSTMVSWCVTWAWQLFGAAAAWACAWVARAWCATGAAVLLRQWLAPLALAGGALCHSGPWALATFSLFGPFKTLAANAGLKRAVAAAQAAARGTDRRAARAAEAGRESVAAAEAHVAGVTNDLGEAQGVIGEVGGLLSEAMSRMTRGKQAPGQVECALRAVAHHLGHLPDDE